MPESAIVAADKLAREQALDLSSSVLCTAPAGSGKTSLLVQRGLACLARANAPEEVLLLTFTNKAAAEIRARLLAALDLAKGEAPEAENDRVTWTLARAVMARDQSCGWGLALTPSRIRAMTLDALCQQINQQAPTTSGMGGGTRVVDDAGPIYRDAVLSMIDDIDVLPENDPSRVAIETVLRLVSNRAETLVEVFSAMLARRDQWMPLLREAPEGASLAEVVHPLIVARLQAIQPLIPQPALDALAVAFRDAGLYTGTTWPAAEPEALEAWRAIVPRLLTAGGDLRKRLTASDGFPPKQPYTAAANAVLASLHEGDAVRVGRALAEVAALPDPTQLTPAEHACGHVSLALQRACAHLLVAFTRAGGVDFVEVARRALAALWDSEGSTPLLERMDYRIAHILLDEAQDTSASQYALLRALTTGWTRDDGRTVFIVGDPAQSIYGFRQAEVRLFTQMQRDAYFGDIPLRCLMLSRNFRSDPEIVGWVNQVFSRLFPIESDPVEGAISHTVSAAARPVGDGEVSVHPLEAVNDEEEARQVVAAVQRAMQARPESSIAILARSRSHVRASLEALHEAGIRVSCKDIDPLTETPAVQDAVALVRALWHEGDRTAWGTLMRAPFVGMTLDDLQRLLSGATCGSVLDALRAGQHNSNLSSDGRGRLTRVLHVLDTALADLDLAQHLGQLARAIWMGLDAPACLTAVQRADVDAAFALLDDCLLGGRLEDISLFEAKLARLYAHAAGGPVQVMTMHGAKGLEFDTVLLVGLWHQPPRPDKPLLAYQETRDGCLVVPLPGYRGDAQHARLYDLVLGLHKNMNDREQLRLLYVACTRAREHLDLFVPAGGSGTAGSAAAALAPALRLDPADPAPRDAAPVRAGGALEPDYSPCPRLMRLPAGYTSRRVASYVPAAVNTLQPSELAVRGEESVRRSQGDLHARLVGTAYHETLQFLLDRGQTEAFSALGDRIRIPMAAGLRRRGMPAPEIAGAVVKIYTLVARTMASHDGRWIVAPHANAHNEYRVTAFLNGEWTSAVIDRTFQDGDTQWVIDYKTTGLGMAATALAGHLRIESERYRDQILRYMELMGRLTGRTVRGGLFFATTGQFVEVKP